MTFNSKYNEGDTLWCLEKSKIFTGVVTGVLFQYNVWLDKKTSEHYWIKQGSFEKEPSVYKSLNEVFPTKEELLKSLE